MYTDNMQQSTKHAHAGKILFLFLVGVAILIGLVLVLSPVTIAGNS